MPSRPQTQHKSLRTRENAEVVRTDQSEGKRRSSENALKHDVFAERAIPVLGDSSENPEEVDAYLSGIIEALGPQTPLKWRRLRWWPTVSSSIDGSAIRAEL